VILLPERTDYESKSYSKLIEDVSVLSEKYYSIEEINFAGEIEKAVLKLLDSLSPFFIVLTFNNLHFEPDLDWH
jgi:hypothetical protein